MTPEEIRKEYEKMYDAIPNRIKRKWVSSELISIENGLYTIKQMYSDGESLILTISEENWEKLKEYKNNDVKDGNI